MDCVRIWIAAFALVSTTAALPGEAAAQPTGTGDLAQSTPHARALAVLRQMQQDSVRVDSRHWQAAQRCDRAAMREYQRQLDSLAAQARNVIRNSGLENDTSSNAITADQIAENIEVRARHAASRQPQNCDKAAAQEPLGATGTAGETGASNTTGPPQQEVAPAPAPAPGPRFNSGSPLDGIRNRAWSAMEEMTDAYEKCDPERFERALNELEQLRREAKAAADAATGSGEFSTITPEEARNLAAELQRQVEMRRNTLDGLRRECSKGHRPGGIGTILGPRRPDSTGTAPGEDGNQQQQQQRQQEPGAQLFDRAFKQLLSPPDSHDRKPTQGLPSIFGTNEESSRKDNAAPRQRAPSTRSRTIDDPDAEELIEIPDGGVTNGRIMPVNRDEVAPPSPPANAPRAPGRDRGRDFCDDGTAVNAQGDCDSNAQCAGGAVCVNDNGGRFISTSPRPPQTGDHCAPGDRSCEQPPDCSRPGADPRRCPYEEPGPLLSPGPPSDCSKPGADPRRCPDQNSAPPPPERTTLDEIEESDRAAEEQRRAGSMPRTAAPPPAHPSPPPRPSASDEAPGGQESRHPLASLADDAWQRFEAARRACDTEAMDRATDEMRYAISEMSKRAEAAREAGEHSAVKPADVYRNLNKAMERLEIMVTAPRFCPVIRDELIRNYPRRPSPPPATPPTAPPPPPPPQ